MSSVLIFSSHLSKARRKGVFIMFSFSATSLFSDTSQVLKVDQLIQTSLRIIGIVKSIFLLSS